VNSTLGYCHICGVKLSKTKYRSCSRHAGRDRVLVVNRKSEPPTPQPTPCIIWRGSVDHDGYGLRAGKRIHRWVVETASEDQYGTVWDPSLIVMHLCDNPPCYRFDHLRIGTPGDNTRDSWAKGRSTNNLVGVTRPRGEQHGHAKLSWDDVAEIQRRIAFGENQRDIASDFRVSPATITNIKKGKVWTRRPAEQESTTDGPTSVG